MKRKMIRAAAYICILTMMAGSAPASVAGFAAEEQDTIITDDNQKTAGTDIDSDQEQKDNNSDRPKTIKAQEDETDKKDNQTDHQNKEAEKQDNDAGNQDNITGNVSDGNKKEETDIAKDADENAAPADKSQDGKEKNGSKGKFSKKQLTGMGDPSDQSISFSLDKTSWTYTGNEIRPAVKDVTLKKGNTTTSLNAGQYSVLYEDNVNIGSNAAVIVHGKGEYANVFATVYFTITSADISTGCTASLNQTSFVYNGSAFYPAASLQYNGKTLVKDTDYTVSYYNNVNAGIATVTVTGKGNFVGQVTMNFSIARASQNFNAAVGSNRLKKKKTTRVTVSGSNGTLSYSSSKPAVASVNRNGLIKAKQTGTTLITVTAAGTQNYLPQSQTLKITVIGIGLTSKNTKVYLSKSSYTYNGKARKPSVKVKYKGKTLKRNRDYKLRYVNNINAGKAAAVVTGINKYSGTLKKYFKIKMIANDLKVTISDTTLDIGETAVIKVKKAYGDVTFSSDNSKVATVSETGIVKGRKYGTATITVTAGGDQNHKKAVKKFQVSVGDRDLSDSDCSVSLSSDEYVYDGSFKMPAVTVYYDGTKLKLKRDYTLTYYDNKNAGTARVVIRGTGQYTGSRTEEFTIYKAEQSDFTASIPNNHIPLGGKARLTASGYKGSLSYDSWSPSYAKYIGGGWYKGMTKTQNYVTITVTASGNENYKSKTIEKRVTIY
ncbi:MAG: Ig-like domain-containing protein [Eubacterium sp.]|nr:Ig-like domain-containing protein [Eubacterium sp.]